MNEETVHEEYRTGWGGETPATLVHQTPMTEAQARDAHARQLRHPAVYRNPTLYRRTITVSAWEPVNPEPKEQAA